VNLPPEVRPGDVIVAVAPSSPFEHALAYRGLAFLAERYRVRFDHGLFERSGYLAGDASRRRAELERALFHPEARAVIAVRGGVGASHFAHLVDWAAFARSPKWLVGFSDITTFHLELAKVGVPSLHASHITALGRADRRLRADLLQALESPRAPRSWTNLEVITRGRAAGPLFGGNLAMLHAAAAAGRLRVPEGAVLLLEDVTERPYRIDRMLMNLEVGGHLARLSAVLLGEFAQCLPGPDGVSVEAVLRERLAGLGVPVVAGLPVGHGARNDAIVLGAHAELDATGPRGTLHVALR
jgi:muramoyltetrapeptide carboxypeptidase